MARFDLSDQEWAIIAPLLPNKPRGVPRQDDRRVLRGELGGDRTAERVAEVGEPFGADAERVVREAQGGACVEGGRGVGRLAGETIVAAELRQEHGHARPADDLACPRHEVAGEIRVAVKGDEEAARARRITDDETGECRSVLGAVRDVPHGDSAGAVGQRARPRPWRLEDDALLVRPEHAEQQHIDGKRDRRSEQKHVGRRATEAARASQGS